MGWDGMGGWRREIRSAEEEKIRSSCLSVMSSPVDKSIISLPASSTSLYE